MYLRQALGRCRDLEEEVAAIYETLATQQSHNATVAAAWRELAEDERDHARQLAALLSVLDALVEDGPFLVGLARQMSECSNRIRECQRRISGPITEAEAIELCVGLEGSELNDLMTEMRELARPAIKRLTDRLYRSSASQRSHQERLDNLRRLADTPIRPTLHAGRLG